LEYSSCLKGRS